MNSEFSLVIIHEGHTTTQKILERGFSYLEQESGLKFRVIEVKPDTIYSIGELEVPVLVRCGSPWVANLTQKLVRDGKPYLYFIDDDFWSIDFSSALGRYYRSPSILASLEIILSNAEIIVTNTKILADRVRKFNSKVSVVPPYFDFMLVDNTSSTKVNPSKPPGSLRIGFASNHSRLPDFKPIEETLLGILRDYSNCEIDIIGFTPDLLREHPSVNIFPHMDSYEEYIAFQLHRDWDIGLAPLRPSRQNSAKTNNKYREYAAMSIAGVYADEAPYDEVIIGETGMKAGHRPQEWDRAIRELLDNVDLRRQIVANGLVDVRIKYSISNVMDSWLKILEEIAKVDRHNVIDWNRDNVSVRQSRLGSTWFLFRTQGFLTWSAYYIRRIKLMAYHALSEKPKETEFFISSITSASTWLPPRDRFGQIPPMISVVLTIDNDDSFDSVFSAIDSILIQKMTDYELLIIADTDKPDILEYLNSLHSTRSNIGIIFHLNLINSFAISFAEGYLKTRGSYVLPATGKMIYAADALKDLYSRVPRNLKAQPVCILAKSVESVPQNPFVPNGSESTVLFWPKQDTEFEFVSLIDRRIFESIGLFDPHDSISHFTRYDLWKRIASNYDIDYLDKYLASSSSAQKASETSSSNLNWPLLEWIGHNRDALLLPNTILGYNVCTVPEWVLQQNTKSSKKSRRIKRKPQIAVVSYGPTNDAELYFNYLPEQKRQPFKLISYPTTDEFDKSILSTADAVIWVNEDQSRLRLEEVDEHDDRPNYRINSKVSVDESFLELRGLDFSRKAPLLKRILLCGSKDITLPASRIPFWLSKERVNPPLPTFARETNSLTITVICDANSIDTIKTIVAHELAFFAGKTRTKVRLLLFTPAQAKDSEWPASDWFEVQRLPFAENKAIALRRISRNYPDFLMWGTKDDISLLGGPGLSSEAIAAILGCFNVFLSQVKLHNDVDYRVYNPNILGPRGFEPLLTFLNALSEDPDLREEFAKNNQSVAISHNDGSRTKKIIQMLMDSAR